MLPEGALRFPDRTVFIGIIVLEVPGGVGDYGLVRRGVDLLDPRTALLCAWLFVLGALCRLVPGSHILVLDVLGRLHPDLLRIVLIVIEQERIGYQGLPRPPSRASEAPGCDEHRIGRRPGAVLLKVVGDETDDIIQLRIHRSGTARMRRDILQLLLCIVYEIRDRHGKTKCLVHQRLPLLRIALEVAELPACVLEQPLLHRVEQMAPVERFEPCAVVIRYSVATSLIHDTGSSKKSDPSPSCDG